VDEPGASVLPRDRQLAGPPIGQGVADSSLKQKVIMTR
jgi:hypothetical protein